MRRSRGAGTWSMESAAARLSIVIWRSTVSAQARDQDRVILYSCNPMGRFYRPDEDLYPLACYDKKHLEIWILGQFSTYEREDDWNHWEIFGRRGLTVGFVGSYWWWGVWDPEPDRPDSPWDPYWSDEDLSQQDMVHSLYLDALEDDSPQMSLRSYG